MITDTYETVKRWTTSLVPWVDGFKKVAVWVWPPIILVQLYTKPFMQRIGNRIGKILRDDETTLVGTRGEFAKVRIEIDLDKPLTSKFTFHMRVDWVEYEGLHVICFGYGKYGHSVDKCPKKIKANQEQGNKEGDDTNMEQPLQDIEISRHELFNKFREWMFAKTRVQGIMLNWGSQSH